MSDLIRREDAIGEIRKECQALHILGIIPLATVGDIVDAVNRTPAIEPKRGKWIFKTVFPNDKSEFPMGYLVCSVCGSHHSNSTPCNYCDNCGARMKGADDE